MLQRLAPAALVAVAALAGLHGADTLGRYALLVAIPAGAASALVLLGELIDAADGDGGQRRTLELALSVLGLTLTVAAAALAFGDGALTSGASASALVGSVAVLGAQAFVSALTPLTRPSERVAVERSA